MILVNKSRGITPLEAIEKLRRGNDELRSEKLAYAGRLDPQAEGLLIILQGEECKNRDSFQSLDKVYEFELLLGVSTDTGDIMGLPRLGINSEDINPSKLEQSLTVFQGNITQNYPAYSSKAINGLPLYSLANKGEFPKVSHQVEVFEIKILESKTLPANELLEFIHKNIIHVTGNFRQGEIINAWNDLLADQTTVSWQVHKLWAHVSSGTYIRQLCNDIGEKLGTGGLALSINRLSVGSFNLYDAILPLSTPSYRLLECEYE